MALQVWLPLIKNAYNYGISKISVTANSVTQTSAEGKLGSSYSFDGSTSYIRMPMPSTMKTLKNTSVCMWVKSTASDGKGVGGIMHDQSSAYSCMCLTGTWQFVTGSAWQYVDGGNYKGTNEWHHAACTMDDTNIKTYLDGNLVSDVTIASVEAITDITSEHFICIGCDFPGANECFTGYINDFRVYDHCLSKREVKEISKALVCHYQLNETDVEKTTNIITSQYITASSGTGCGGHTSEWTIVDASDFPIPARQCNKVAVTYAGSGTGGLGRFIQTITCEPSSTYTYSCYIKTPDELGPLNANILYRYEYDSNDTQLKEKGCWENTNYQSLGDNWYRLWGTFTITDNTTSFKVYSYMYPCKTCDYYIGCWQLEAKDHVTPYIFGIRNNCNIIWDSSGYSNNGIKSGGVTISSNTAQNNSCLSFDGDTGFIECPPLPSSTITISVWIKTPWVAPSDRYQIAMHDLNTKLAIGWSHNGKQLITFIGGSGEGGIGSRLVMTTTNYTANKWNHIVLIKTGDNTRDIYVNGIKASPEGSNYWAGDTNKLYIGNRHSAGDYYNYIEAEMSDFRAYATALSADDIKELYNSPINFNKHSIMTQGEFIEK